MAIAGSRIDSWPPAAAVRLLDHSVDLACVIGSDGRLREATGRWAELLGWSTDSVLSRMFVELVADEDAAAAGSHLDSARAAPHVARLQGHFRCADGSTRWLQWILTALAEHGDVYAIGRDLTAQHAADARVRESEQRYLDLIESAHDIVQSILPDGHFEFVNRAWHEHLGYTAEELPDLTLFDIIDEVDHDHCTVLIGQIMSGRSFDRVEITFVAKDGRKFPAEGNATGRFRDGRFVATHTFFRDVSDRKQAEALQAAYQRELEEEVAERTAALVQSEKLATLGRLSAGMAHELNNPAAAARRGASLLEDALTRACAALLDLAGGADGREADMLGELIARAAAPRPDRERLDPLSRGDREEEIEDWLTARGLDDSWSAAGPLADLGMDPTGLDALARAFTPDHLGAAITALTQATTAYGLIAQVGNGAERISQIVTALKDYSYMDRSPVQDVDVHEGLDGTLVMLQSKLKQGIDVVREYGDVPRIETIGSELNQVWTNLVDNAADAMGERGRLIIRTRARDGGVAVEIEDDGPGIPADALSHVFDPFFTTKPPGQGTGLGLNIVFNMIRGSGGTIEVDSDPGRTVFHVWLPPRRPVDPPAGDAPAGHAPSEIGS